MKRLLLVLGLLTLFLAAGGLGKAQADGFLIIFDDKTDIQKWQSGSTPSYTSEWVDVLESNERPFQTSGGKFTFENNNLYLYLYTKFGPAGVTYPAAWKTIQVADLFFDTDVNGSFDMAIRLRSDGLGNVYTGLEDDNINISVEIMKGSSSGWLFGGKFDKSNPTDLPVEVVYLDPSTTTDVSWSDSPDSNVFTRSRFV